MSRSLAVAAALGAALLALGAEGRSLPVAEDDGLPIGCHLAKYNFTFVQRDGSGKRCRGEVLSFACFGYCDTYELAGDGGGMTGNMDVCMYEDWVDKVAVLSDCDEGVDPRARNYPYREALGCKCGGCDPTRMSCHSIAKRPKKAGREGSAEEDPLPGLDLDRLRYRLSDVTPSGQPGPTKASSVRWGSAARRALEKKKRASRKAKEAAKKEHRRCALEHADKRTNRHHLFRKLQQWLES